MFKRAKDKELIPRIVIGGGADDKVPALVTEFSIRQRTWDKEVDIIHTHDLERPMFEVHRNPTQFSLVRWWIPELCGYQGKAIYLDSDMVILDNIAKLYNIPTIDFQAHPNEHRAVLRTPDPSVMLIDCGHEFTQNWNAWDIRDKVDSGEMRYHEMWGSTNFMPLEGLGELPEEWNHRDHYEEGVTKNLHYTMLKTQPWRVTQVHPLERIWVDALVGACKAGVVKPSDLVASPFYVNIRECLARCQPAYLEEISEEITNAGCRI